MTCIKKGLEFSNPFIFKMEKELKTLKDLHDFYEENWRELDMDFIDFIKAEAVKWYKDLLQAIDNPKEDCPVVTWNYSIAFIRNWIKHFFNITEEDKTK